MTDTLVGEATAADPQYLLETGGTCGAATSQTVWAATSTYAFGDLHVGVRASTTRLKSTLDRILEDRWVPDGQAPPNFSVDLGQSSAVGVPFGFLLRGSAKLVRARDPRRLVLALMRYLEGLAPPPAGDRVRVMTAALVIDDRALLVPRSVLNAVEFVERRLRAHGVLVLEAPFAELDPATGELVVPELSRPVTAEDWQRVDEAAGTGPREDVVAPGRYRLVGAGRFASAGGREPTLAQMVHGMAAQLAQPADVSPQETLDRLVRCLAPLPRYGLRGSSPAEVARHLTGIAADLRAQGATG